MGHLTNSANAESPATIILFGPQYTHFSHAELSTLQSFLVNDLQGASLARAINDLPSLWPSVEEACPPLSRVQGLKSLQLLTDFLQTGTIPDLDTLPNLVFTPLTVLRQAIEFLRLRRGDESLGPPIVQGFCVGFLTAAAVASSQSSSSLQENLCAALRLAVCIGAIIDLDQASKSDRHDQSSAYALRWKKDVDRAKVDELLSSYPSAYLSCITDKRAATLTVASRDAEPCLSKLRSVGMASQGVGLHGRFHLPVHIEPARLMKTLCKNDKRFQLQMADPSNTQLRSNSDASTITQGALHDVALDTILNEQSQWYQTVQSTVSSLHSENVVLQTLGSGNFVPRSLSNELSVSQSSSFTTSLDTTQESSVSRSLDADPSNNPIAIVGMACRFPQSNNVEDFWRLLAAGKAAVREMPKARFDTSELWRQPKGPFLGNFLDDPDVFDYRFFGISGREAKSMDPQQRLLLQVAYETMESSGYFGPGSDQQSKDVGCYVGVGAVDYGDNVASQSATAFSALGTLRAFISGRVSHHFGWSGPSITYDTACSSSAVALHSACKALQAGECSSALAGGVNVITSPALHQNLAAASFLNPTGASKAFDASANGYCRGEGAGLVLLKPLARAEADGNPILGVIAGSAVNQGSNCTPITVPVSESQNALYQQTLQASGTDPSSVSYVEAHGTGTPVGDPIEAESIRQVFGGAHRSDELFLGSVKDNIGHAEAASGVAALVKAILMVQKRAIPKQANFSSLNPKISNLEPDKMAIAKSTRAWDTEKLAAVINNYGAAGSNAALLLKEYESFDKDEVTDMKHMSLSELPIYVSAKTADSLRAYCAALKSTGMSVDEVHGAQALPNLAYNLSRKQNRDLEFSKAFTASSMSQFAHQLEAVSSQSDETLKRASDTLPVVLCFSGQTGDTVSLSKTLFDNSQILQNHLTDCDSMCRALGLPGIVPRIFDPSPVEDIVNLHCMLFSLQYSSAKSWLDSGIEVDTLVGHSFGQLTALCVAGNLSLEDGLRLVSGRARLIKEEWGPENGVMLSIEGGLHDVRDALRLAKEKASSLVADIACYNGPKSFVVAGTETSIATIEEILGDPRSSSLLKARRLRNTHAFHSQLADSITPAFLELAESITFTQPSLHVETCSQGQSWTDLSPSKIIQHTREPVYFSDAIGRIAARLPSAVWLEASSGGPIISMVRRALPDDAKNTFLPADIGGTDALRRLAKITRDLWDAGSKAQFWPFHRVQKNSYAWVNLPPYQFEQTRQWTDYVPLVQPGNQEATIPIKEQAELVSLKDDHTNKGGEALFEIDSTNSMFQHLTKGHAVLNHALTPASMYFEMAVRGATVLRGKDTTKRIPHIQELKISAPLGLAQKLFMRLLKDQNEQKWHFTFFSREKEAQAAEIVHATGTIAMIAFRNAVAASRFNSLKRLVKPSRYNEIPNHPKSSGLSGPAVYQLFGSVVNYADYYRGVKSVHAHEGEVVGTVTLPDDVTLDKENRIPIAIDNFLQVAGIHVNCLWDRKDSEVWMCTAVGGLLMSEHFVDDKNDQRSWTVYSNFQSSKNRVGNDIFILDPNSGELVLTIMDAQFMAVPLEALSKTLAELDGPVRSAYPSPTDKEVSKPVADEDSVVVDISNESDSQSVSDEAPDRAGETTAESQTQVLEKIQDMFSEVMEIPAEDVNMDTSLNDLGVDSLMVTEVLKEIEQRFDVSMTAADFAEFDNIQSLCSRISPASSAFSTPQNSSETASQSESVGSWSPPTSPQSPASTVGDSDDLDEKPSYQSRKVDLTAIAADDVNEKPSYQQPKADFAAIAAAKFHERGCTYDQLTDQTNFTGFCEDVYPLQAELVTSYVCEAFTALGCPIASLEPNQRLPEIKFTAKNSKVVKQYYKVLQDANLITKTGDVYQRTSKEPPHAPSGVLQSEIVKQFPQHASEHKLLHTTGSYLADCLTERADPLGLLFRDARARELMEDVYTNAPMFKTGTVLLAQYLCDVFRAIPRHKEIKILELGAGTGGTTTYLIDKLVKTGQPFRYTFTDLSSSLVAMAKKKFKKYDFMDYALVDIEKTPTPQYTDQYDIILSTNCIHATKNLVNSTTNIRKMLRPDGILCLVELTQNLFWFDLVFGLVEGWWLFNDGREHVLADENRWKHDLSHAGFEWVDWSQGDSAESRICRVITASPSKAAASNDLESQETVTFKEADGVRLHADIYYPTQVDQPDKRRPIALMIHGGGHVMLSRNDVRPQQTQTLLDAGFLPVSVDYRLCPETTLVEGPMTDVCDALEWTRTTLPYLQLKRADVQPDGENVVAIGWSTGGHLAMSLAWTSIANAVRSPQAILAFYCPSDYEDSFWTQPNVPRGSNPAALDAYDVMEGVRDSPITAYNVPPSKTALGGWMAPSDPRSRIALHMNWKGQALPTLLNGLQRDMPKNSDGNPDVQQPSKEQIQAVSPLAQIKAGRYNTPTFIVHGTRDDLIPWQQAQRTYDGLVQVDVAAQLRLVKGALHLFDVYDGWDRNEEAERAVKEGYEFLGRAVGL